MNCPKVSLLLPIYNVEKYIENCAHSLFKQSYCNIEFIFVNDCSCDNSVSILRNIIQQYPSRAKNVRILSHDRNRGVAAARNLAVEQASGDYLIWVDGDDYIDTDAVSLLVQRMQETGADIVLADAYFVYENRMIIRKIPLLESPQRYLELVLKRQVALSVWGKLFKKDLFCDVRFVEGVNFGEDYSVLPCLIYNATKIAKVDAPLYYYIQYNANSYTRNLTLNSLNQVCAANEHIASFFSDKNINYEVLMLQSKLYLKLHLLKNVYKDKNLLKEVVNRYMEVDAMSIQLSWPDRIVFYLSKRHWYSLLTIYLNVALFSKKYVRFCF